MGSSCIVTKTRGATGSLQQQQGGCFKQSCCIAVACSSQGGVQHARQLNVTICNCPISGSLRICLCLSLQGCLLCCSSSRSTGWLALPLPQHCGSGRMQLSSAIVGCERCCSYDQLLTRQNLLQRPGGTMQPCRGESSIFQQLVGWGTTWETTRPKTVMNGPVGSCTVLFCTGLHELVMPVLQALPSQRNVQQQPIRWSREGCILYAPVLATTV